MRPSVALGAALLALACSQTRGAGAASSAARDPALPAAMRERAVFAAGGFWSVEAVYRAVDGVLETSVGFTGGQTPAPTYRQVCGGGTGHAEAVEVWFDPARTSYARLLEVFFANHDPTQVNRQGPDVGDQYRSAIFFTTPEQQRAARDAIAALEESGRWQRPIATQVVPLTDYWKAEDYHQQYYEKQGLAGRLFGR
jgi:methionine-S-sulfoxide reductase